MMRKSVCEEDLDEDRMSRRSGNWDEEKMRSVEVPESTQQSH